MSALDGAVTLGNLTKKYGPRTVVDDISLEIKAGEFFSLLGPSGCGKTTTLRMIGGFENPDHGKILVDDLDITDHQPEDRPLNTVFQNYSLFPHLNVRENVAFGLRFEKSASEKSRSDRVSAALTLVQLEKFGNARVHELSGGEQQRVALARALILEPSVLLLDEPLGALDAQLRSRLQIELASLQKQIGITFIYVTHDQYEAFTMSDRIGVMSKGKLLQVGSPREIYERPQSVEVAKFIGVANLVQGSVTSVGSVNIGDHQFTIPSQTPLGNCTVMIRPERVRLGVGSLLATVERVTFAGSSIQVALVVGNIRFVAEVPNDENSQSITVGSTTPMEILPDAMLVLKT